MSVVGIIAKHFPVGVEYFGFRYESHIFAVVYHREIPGICLIESIHDLLHGLAYVYAGRRCRHETCDVHFLIQIWPEHYVPDVVKKHHSQQLPVIVCDREKIAA